MSDKIKELCPWCSRKAFAIESNMYECGSNRNHGEYVQSRECQLSKELKGAMEAIRDSMRGFEEATKLADDLRTQLAAEKEKYRALEEAATAVVADASEQTYPGWFFHHGREYERLDGDHPLSILATAIKEEGGG